MTCSIRILTDSDSARKAIGRYRRLRSSREQLRTSGRQWLSLITRLIGIREGHGASSHIEWIRAHSTVDSIEHVGNRCADELAKRASAPDRAGGRRRSAVDTTALPIEQEDAWLSMREWDAATMTAGRLVTSDPRGTCIDKMRDFAMQRWSESDTQARFSHPDVDAHALWECVRVRMPALAGCALLFLTDTAHWRRGVFDASRKKVIPVSCAACGVDNTVSHMISCRSLQRRRNDAAASVCSFAHHDEWASSQFADRCNEWQRAGSATDIRDLIVHLRLASGAADSAAVAAAFNSSHAKACMVQWRVPVEARADLVERLRCVLFMWLARAWTLTVS